MSQLMEGDLGSPGVRAPVLGLLPRLSFLSAWIHIWEILLNLKCISREVVWLGGDSVNLRTLWIMEIMGSIGTYQVARVLGGNSAPKLFLLLARSRD